MNWIATNIRFPEEEYQKLKIKAARERKSLAAIIREATAKVIEPEQRQKERELKAKKLITEVRKIGQEMAKYTKGFDSVKALREIRYNE